MSLLSTYLEKFERLIDPQREERIKARYQAAFRWEEMEQLPFCWSDLPPTADQDWPDFAYNDTFIDREKMLLSQLRPAYLHYTSGDDYPLGIRANYGTIILPSILGAHWQLTENSMPWAHHLEGRDAIQRLVDAGMPSLRSGLGAESMDTTQYYYETLAHYPALAHAVKVFHPDLQGPFDTAHLLWGPDIFLALYDCPKLVHSLLELVTATYIAWLSAWKRLAGEGNDWTVHWNIWQKGGAMLRDDSAVMLSGDQYHEFVQPYDQRVLDTFGGCIHFCGRGAQFIASMSASRGLYGLNLSQPELNNMTRVSELCAARRLVLLDLNEDYVPVGVDTGVTIRRSWAKNKGK
ncbi:MAG: uroporphyrinogen decarboxylase family protein [Chloroflexi bacterium]|nr:uroporphyrinogen decarboxylase family protein [Chloroflexota bacterium]